MNWIRQNKFLAGFIGVMVVGIGVLGFLLYSGYSQFSDVSDTYTQQATELHRLVTLVPYPDQANVKKMQELKNAYRDAVLGLQKDLVSYQFPLEPLAPEAFQDRLRVSVGNVKAKADAVGAKLPEK